MIEIFRMMSGLGGWNSRRVLYPTADPSAIGRRIEAGKLLKMASGRVSWGMYVVMVDEI